MKQLLSSRSQRVLNIMDHLIQNPHGVLVSDLASLNNCTVQTVYNDIKYIRTEFSHCIDLANLGNTLRLTNYSISSLMEIKVTLLNDSLALNILFEIYFGKDNTIASIAQKFNYSEVHVRSKIKEINEVFQDFKFRICIQKNLILAIITEEPVYFIYFIGMVTAMTHRSIDDYLHQDLSPELLKSLEVAKLPVVLEKYIKDIYKHYLYYYGETDSFTSWINNHLQTTNLLKATEKCVHSLNGYKNYTLDAQTIRFMEKCCNVLVLMSHLQPKVIDNFFNRYHYFYSMFRKDNRVFIAGFEVVLQKIESRLGVNMQFAKEKIIYHLYLHVHHISLRNPLRIGVYSKLGDEHANVLAHHIKDRFPEHSIEVFSENIDDGNFDLICSTYPLSSVESKKQIIINDFVSLQDFSNIYQAINEFYQIQSENQASVL